MKHLSTEDEGKLKKYGITLDVLAEMHGYSNALSFRTSSACKKRIQATIKAIKRVERYLANTALR